MEAAARLRGALRSRIGLILGLALVASLTLSSRGYAGNAPVAFHAGLLLAAAALALLSYRAARRGRRAPVFIANTASCLLVSIVGIELVQNLATHVPRREDGASAGPGTPDLTALREFFVARKAPYLMPDPQGKAPFVLKPGSYPGPGKTQIHINRLGFRGPEIPLEKGDAYRIVVLGESTTFGLTRRPGDRPWPRVLEALLASHLNCDAPIEVINAGVPGWTVATQYQRLARDILPLDPDLILSYHGYNGFHFILDELPDVLVDKAPTTPTRPSKLLQQTERALRLWWFRRRYRASQRVHESRLDIDLLETDYAARYRWLAYSASRRQIGLGLCTFNMAVNGDSSEEAIRHYETAFPDVRARILANRMHSEIVRQLGRRPEILALDSPGLDGAGHELFVDLVHLNQRGRDHLARSVLAGLRDLLRADPKLNCRPRAASSR
jgi:lysophospholipase L1-like esterase